MLSHGVARLRRLIEDTRGAIAPMFAVSLIPLIIVAGVGVDMSRGMASRNNLQDALDATGLAIAHLPPTTSLATLNTKANAWLTANLTDANLGPITLTLTRSQGQIVLNATSTVKTTLTGLAGVSTMPVKAATTVKWGLSHVEIALVLDNTGSMAGTKLSTLISAAQDLVDTLDSTSDHADPEALKIAVVPFSMTVNIGSGYQGQSWLTGTMPTQYGDDAFDSSAGRDRFGLFASLNKSWAGCVESRPAPYDVQDTAPSTGTPATLFLPFFAPDEPGDGNGYDGSNWLGYPNDYIADVKQDRVGGNPSLKEREIYTAKYSTIWGCASRRSNGSCIYNDWITGTPTQRPGVNSSTGYAYGPNAGCSLTPVLRLTNSISTVKTKLGQMQAIGDTNIPMGLVWGWHALSPNLPFGDGTAYGTTGVKKIVVLLTDGDNTMTNAGGINSSYYSGLSYIWQNRLGITSGSSGTRTAAMDARMALLCSNMKQSDITIYAVRIDVSGTAPAALSGCASQPEYFYDVPDVANLADAFNSIAGQIGDLRIAK